jgi:hypothetical protein
MDFAGLRQPPSNMMPCANFGLAQHGIYPTVRCGKPVNNDRKAAPRSVADEEVQVLVQIPAAHQIDRFRVLSFCRHGANQSMLGRAWTWRIARPCVVLGSATQANRNGVKMGKCRMAAARGWLNWAAHSQTDWQTRQEMSASGS